MGIRGLFIGTRADKDAPKRPSQVWEITHPRKAEALWAALEEEAEVQIEEAERQEAERDAADDRWAAYAVECDLGRHQGNPPDSRLLEMQIGHYAGQYPEITDAERAQAEYRAELDERGLDREGPGYTEPPLDWEGWHEDHKGWTFTEWAEARGWDAEHVAEINAEFPPDQAETEYVRKCREHEAEELANYEADQEFRDDGPESGRAGVEMGEDYYTQPVGSERHREAYRAQFEAGGRYYSAFPEDADMSYSADNWAELEYDRWQAKQEATDREDGPEPGTNEWHYEYGYDPEPDWSSNPAVDDRHGHLYYNDGKVTQFDGTVIHEAPKEAGQ
jgi:hypothetical protein